MGHTEDCDPEFGCDEKCTAPLPPEEAVPISSPRCDAWRPAVDGDPYPSTEVRCAFAAGHPGKHSRYQVQW